MRAIVAALCVVALSGCTADSQPEPAPPEVTETAVPALVVQAMPRDLTSLPRLRTALPRRIPSDVSALPALVDDPPGRAIAVYHPPELWPEPVEGWASETLLFCGVDGEWRRLRMDELGLPDDTWAGHDTYGAGSLSPDGRWWAAHSRDGVVLLDLRTGTSETLDVGLRWASVEWRADSRSFVVGRGGPGRRPGLIELPSLRRTTLPYQYWQASFAPDGTQLSLRRTARDRVELLTWDGDRAVSRGQLSLPGLGSSRDRRPFGAEVTDGRLLTVVQRPPYRTLDLVVVGIDSVEVEARLHLSARDRGKSYRNATWLDPETVLLEIGPGLIAWRPAEAEFFRVMASPTPHNGFASLRIATDLAR